MKKLFLILVLCLVWNSNSFSQIIKLTECYDTGEYINFKASKRLKDEVTINLETRTVRNVFITADGTEIISNPHTINDYDETKIYTRDYDDLLEDYFVVAIDLKLGTVRYFFEKDYARRGTLVKCNTYNTTNSKDNEKSSGTAFFINSKGYLLTNNHVVEGCELQQVKYNDKDYEAKIIATDKTLDLALIKIEAKPKNYLKFSESNLEKLQKVYVAGYPFGKGLSDDLKISSGIVSSVKGFDDNSNEFQLDAAINPGNSGGPIVDDTGELIGIAVAGLAKDKSEGINFGIKSLSAVAFLKTNNIDPETSIMTFGMNNKKLLQLLEESTVYTYCN